MYCINCGVKLAASEQVCPLCGTDPLQPVNPAEPGLPLYPGGRTPAPHPKSGAVNGTILILFLIPLIVTFLVDLQANRRLDWFGFAAGGLLLAYELLALPRWFRKPNPTVFVPCGFAAAALYLLYLSAATDGQWFLPFALPVTAGMGMISTAAVVLLRHLRRGRLYILGGTSMALGCMILLTEFLITQTFGPPFLGWSLYPLAVLFLLGGLLIFLAINRSAREMMERKLFL